MLLSTFENSFRQSRRGSAAPKPSSLQSENCGPNSSASRGRSGLERAQFKFKMEASISRVRCSGNGPAKTTGSAEPAGNNSKRESHNRTFPLRSSFHKESPFALRTWQDKRAFEGLKERNRLRQQRFRSKQNNEADTGIPVKKKLIPINKNVPYQKTYSYQY